MFNLAICCTVVCLLANPGRISKRERERERERALDGLDFSRVLLGAALLISKADKPSGILKRGKVATVLMPTVTTSE